MPRLSQLNLLLFIMEFNFWTKKPAKHLSKMERIVNQMIDDMNEIGRWDVDFTGRSRIYKCNFPSDGSRYTYSLVVETEGQTCLRLDNHVLLDGCKTSTFTTSQNADLIHALNRLVQAKKDASHRRQNELDVKHVENSFPTI